MRSAFLPLLMLPLLGCSPARPKPPQLQESPYYPLTVGTVWTYRGSDHERVLRVVKHEVVDGTACALVETLRDGQVVAKEYIFARSDGIYGLEGAGKQSAPQPILKLPPTPGRTWNVNFNRGGEVSRGSYIIDPKEEVTVPAGTYQAVPLRGELYQEGERKMAFTYWFAAGVGVVKQHIKLGKQSLDYELLKFEQPK